MASDQHMIETLSGMLQDGETLLHSIFGYIKYNGFQQFAYFGLTETNCLIACLSGENVTDAMRIPLNITSVQIKNQNYSKNIRLTSCLKRARRTLFVHFLRS